MQNDLIENDSWWKKNWKWSLPTSVLFLLITLIIFLNSSSENSIFNIAYAYSDEVLFEQAIEKVRKNQKVLDIIGNIEKLDKLAILEGNVVYSDNNNQVKASVRLTGTKDKAKMDVVAVKVGKNWIYKKIVVRIKSNKENIIILNDSLDLHL